MCANCDYQVVLDRIRDILDSGEADDSAVEFLDGVHEWVEDNGHATEAQKEGVEKVADRVGI